MILFDYQQGLADEWFETDGFRCSACGTASGPNTRRQHALLAYEDENGIPWVLVNHCEEWVELSGKRFPLTATFYHDETEAARITLYPHGYQYLVGFTTAPFVQWTYQVEGHRIVKSIRPCKGERGLFLHYAINAANGSQPVVYVRPMISGRRAGDLHLENARFATTAACEPNHVSLAPYPGVPQIHFGFPDGITFASHPLWYRRIRLVAEEKDEEAYFSPGEFAVPLAPDRQSWIRLATENLPLPADLAPPEQFLDDAVLPPAAVAAFRRSVRCTCSNRAVFEGDEAAPARPCEPDEAILALGLLGDFLQEDLLLCLLRRYVEAIPAATLDLKLWWVIIVAEAVRRGARVDRASSEQALEIMERLLARRSSGTEVIDQMLLRVTYPDASWWQRHDEANRRRWEFPLDIQALWLNALYSSEVIANSLKRSLAGGRFDRAVLRTEDAIKRHYWWTEASYVRDSVNIGASAPAPSDMPRPDERISSAALLACALRHNVFPASRCRTILRVARDRLSATLDGADPTPPGDVPFYGLKAFSDNARAYPWLLALWWRVYARHHDPSILPIALDGLPALATSATDFTLPYAVEVLKTPDGPALEIDQPSLLSLAGYLTARHWQQSLLPAPPSA